MVRYLLYFCLVLVSSYAHSQINDSIHCIGIRVAEEMPATIEEIVNFVQESIEYPESKLSDSITGIVVISFWVDTLGNTFGHFIERSLGMEFDEEALRITKLIKFQKPAYQGGVPVRILYTIPVKFSLQPEGNNKTMNKPNSVL